MLLHYTVEFMLGLSVISVWKGWVSANITAEIHISCSQLFDFACAYAEDSSDSLITDFQEEGGVRRVPPYQFIIQKLAHVLMMLINLNH